MTATTGPSSETAAGAAVLADLDRALAELPLVAILRGMTPAEAPAVGDALIEAGFRILEVPLNSPDPFDGIARLAERVGDRAVVGAGTVLSAPDAREAIAAGARLIVSPETHPPVIEAALAGDVVAMPGFATPSEAFTALRAGAQTIKLFPAESLGPAFLKGVMAVLPKGTRVIPTGGATPETIGTFFEVGAVGVGIGSALYKPGLDAATVERRARAFDEAWRAWAAAR
ncbi:MAG: 2-dehydro-3-deoxy-6-phosphogalactonate aldolase [Azospirillaceae bacterium]